MKSVVSFLKAHGYGLFMTALVLSLGVISWRLRGSDTPASAEQPPVIPTPAPTASPSPTATPQPEIGWQRPVSGGVLSEYSYALPAWNASMDCWQSHAGIDLAAASGEAVRAAADGEVLSVQADPLLGLCVQINHGEGWVSLYAALAQAQVAPGDRVKSGDVLGQAGNSADSEALLGTLLHFALTRDGLPVKPAF